MTLVLNRLNKRILSKAPVLASHICDRNVKMFSTSPSILHNTQEGGEVSVTTSTPDVLSRDEFYAALDMADSVTYSLWPTNYIAMLYDTVQSVSGLPWWVVIAGGTLTIRATLLKLGVTRNSMNAVRYLKKAAEITKMKDVMESNVQIGKLESSSIKAKVDALKAELDSIGTRAQIFGSFCVISPLMLILTNQGVRKLSSVKALTEGGFGPFLDLTAACSTSYYILPTITISTLAFVLYRNQKHRYFVTNKMLCLCTVPYVGLILLMGNFASHAMGIHLALSTSILIMIHQSRSSEYFAKLIGVSPLTEKELEDFEESKKDKREYEKLLKESRNLRDELGATRWHRVRNTFKKPFRTRDEAEVKSIESVVIDERLERQPIASIEDEEEDVMEVKAPTSASSSRFYEATEALPHYTPYFKIGPFAEARTEIKSRDRDTPVVEYSIEDRKSQQLRQNNARMDELSGSNTFQDTFGRDLIARMYNYGTRFQLYYERAKFYYGDSLKQKWNTKAPARIRFKEAIPIESPLKLELDPIKLTTKVTPGLKRYVLRNQYPLDTLEDMERKRSLIERTQNKRY